ncbi:hypothetical protein [uncultured Methylobacterium sp.]|uniref:hypothetical protein n=1 Tax=uncultured Methylobacterium sp. TaxID=157278 RepID=UPI0035CC35E2
MAPSSQQLFGPFSANLGHRRGRGSPIQVTLRLTPLHEIGVGFPIGLSPFQPRAIGRAALVLDREALDRQRVAAGDHAAFGCRANGLPCKPFRFL